MMKRVNKITLLVLQNWPMVLFWAGIAIFFLLNALHESYPDEFDNILGGWYILHGRLPYIGFFTHHGPMSYFFAAIGVLFSGQSFVKFRIVYSIMLFLYVLFFYTFLYKSIGKEIKPILALFVGCIALSATYFWFQMLLADTVSAFLLLPSIALVIVKTLFKKHISYTDLIFISLTTFLSVLSSLTYIYLVLGLYAYALFLFFRQGKKIIRKETIIAIGICIGPYILFVLYLLLTRSLSDYIYQSFVFNEKYYIYNYPRAPGIITINPIRFAVVIAHDFFNNFFALLVQIKDFNVSYPVNITMAIANVAMAIYLLSKRKYLTTIFFIFCCTFANGRSSPLNSGETDYQSAVYIFISLFTASFLLVSLFRDIAVETNDGKKFLYKVLFLPLAFYSLFMGIFFFNKFDNRYYGKYMGRAPLIYDRPTIAPIINSLLTPNDYVWIGPFEFEELFYIHAKLATRYHILNPGDGESERISQGQVKEIEQTKPSIIWYNKNFYILGRKPADYAPLFNAMLDRDYITLSDVKSGKVKYVSAIPITQHVDLETYMYVRKEDKSEVIKKLLDMGYIRETSVK